MVRASFLLLVLVLQSSCASTDRAGITAAEAQMLPHDVLAHRLLGDVGRLMIGVDRPSWGPTPVLAGGPIPWPPKRIPPLHFGLDFYGQATATAVRGICEQLSVDVSFPETPDDATSVPSHVTSIVKYGVGDALEGGDYRESMTTLQSRCAELKGRQPFFMASTNSTARDAARITQRMAEIGRNRVDPSFSFACTFQSNAPCNNIYKVMEDLEWRDIQRADAQECLERKAERCMKIVYTLHIMENGERRPSISVLTLRVRFVAISEAIAIQSVDAHLNLPTF